MQFVLIGFSHYGGFRVFAFERIADDRMRTSFTVRADLALVRAYGIRLQELPLMCRKMLEERSESQETQALTFTEDQMRILAQAGVAARDKAAQKRKPPHKPPTENGGTAWWIRRPH